MDKYQKHLLEYLCIEEWHYIDCADSKKTKGSLNSETGTLTIVQNENPELVEYDYYILNRHDILSKVSFCKGDKWTEIESANFEPTKNSSTCKVKLNFNDRVEKIKLYFKNQLADDYIINVVYVEADKVAWATKLAKEHRESLIAAASIKVSTGVDLVNIYFQPCCDGYAHTEIALFKDDMMLAKYKVDADAFFKSINGLAFGKYEFVLKQFDDKENIILETDKMSFTIAPSGTPMFVNGRRTIVVR